MSEPKFKPGDRVRFFKCPDCDASFCDGDFSPCDNDERCSAEALTPLEIIGTVQACGEGFVLIHGVEAVLVPEDHCTLVGPAIK